MRKTLALLIGILFLQLFSNQVRCQEPERVMYVVDSIPVYNEPKGEDGNIENSDISAITVITEKYQIQSRGFSNIDKLILITTKAYENRPDSIRCIPSTLSMENRNGVLCNSKTKEPYTGRVIDYYFDGKKKFEGYLDKGKLEGKAISFYKNGVVSCERNYTNGIHHGEYIERHRNGVISQVGKFENDKEVGMWSDYYSTGILKRSNLCVNGEAKPSGDEKKFYSLLDEALNVNFRGEDYKGALKKLDKAILLNPNYADAYLYRGRTKFYMLDFDAALQDFEKAIEIEPLYVEAIIYRAFSRIRRSEFKDSRKIKEVEGVTIMATKNDAQIPADELDLICKDLNRAVELGSDNIKVKDAIEKYCMKK